MTDQNQNPSHEEPRSDTAQKKTESLAPPEKKESTTPLRTRILALIGVALMVFLVIMYTYSMATGKIFAW